jgi:peptidoglycan/LPS O-acetylase OafA/YrhL
MDRAPEPPPGERLTGHILPLDGLRGIAILLVMIFHQTVMTAATEVDEAFLTVTGFGWCGVDLFFVLSGFLITGILFDSRESAGYFRNFYCRRIVRIFPLYYAVLFVALVILPRIPHAKSANFSRMAGDEPWYWLYLSNFAIARAGQWRHAILDVSWSLAIEEQFYLVWPVVVLVCSRASLLRISSMLVLAAPVLRALLLWADAAPIAIYVLTPTRIDALAIGAWVALAARQPGGLIWLRRIGRPVSAVAGVAVLGFLVSGRTFCWDPWIQVAGYTALALLAASALVAALTCSPKGWFYQVLTHPLLRSFGKYSYALYLFHLSLRALVRDTVYGPGRFPTIFGSPIPGQLLFYVVATALAYVAAWLSWHCFEVHFLKLKHLFPTARRVCAEQPA